MKCPECGNRNGMRAVYCSLCGSRLRQAPWPVGQEEAGQSADRGEDDTPSWKDPSSEVEEGSILDRDLLNSPESEVGKTWRGALVKVILLVLLVLIAGFSYYGVNAVANLREKQETERVLQQERRAAEQKAAQRSSYLRWANEYIILAQAQGEDFKTNLEGLENIENRRWLNDIFLEGLFNFLIEKFTGTESYTAMTKRSSLLSQGQEKLTDAPAELVTLADQARDTQALGQSITAHFTGALTEGSYDAIAALMKDYEQSLAQLKSSYEDLLQS